MPPRMSKISIDLTVMFDEELEQMMAAEKARRREEAERKAREEAEGASLLVYQQRGELVSSLMHVLSVVPEKETEVREMAAEWKASLQGLMDHDPVVATIKHEPGVAVPVSGNECLHQVNKNTDR